MEVAVNKSWKYEIDCDFNGNVIACFGESLTYFYDSKQLIIGEGRHRDLMLLDDLKKIVSKLTEVKK